MLRHKSWLGAAFALSASLVALVGLPVKAVQLADGTVYFVRPPELAGAATTFNAAYFWGATYYFTLVLPENAGEPLQKVVIAPQEGPDWAYLDEGGRNIEAFEGTHHRSGTKLPLKEVAIDPKTHEITIVFDPPVAPGRTLTIALYPVRNPDTGGVYLYGVTAFPVGEKSHGQFLGYGRIHIYDIGRGLFFY